MNEKRKLEAKLRIFEAIANNIEKMCDKGYYMSPTTVANNVNQVFRILTNNEDN